MGKAALRIAWPEGLVTIAALALVRWPPPVAMPFLRVYPYVVLAAGVVLGWRFGRGRLLGALILLVLADRALALVAPARGITVAIEIVAILLPVNLALLAFLPESGVFSRGGYAWLAAIAAQITLVAVASRIPMPGVADALSLPLFPIAFLERARTSQVAIATFLVTIGLTGYRATLTRDAAARGLLWATLAALVALNATGSARTLYFATAGLAIVAAMLEASYALAFHDDLTGLPGRRAFNQQLGAVSGDYAIAMVDVDHFKQFNDRYGHDVGDQVLKLVANRLAAIAGGGRAFRYGGEEFAVLFPSALREAEPHLEAVRADIETTTFTLRGRNRPRKGDTAKRGKAPKRRDISVTVSIGAAQGRSKHREPAAVIKAADEALYRAKDAGRNRVVLAE